jgi:hypothetical protein
MRGAAISPARRALVVLGAILTAVVFAAAGGASHGSDPEITVGSNDNVFSQNKQNEPTVSINPLNPLQVGAGANDNLDLEACNVGADNTCPFTDGVGVTGFQASTNGGASWVQPTYTGWTARHCLGAPGPGDTCTPAVGPIGTVPWYFENGLVADGDPVQAWGPRRGANGQFSWTNGARLYFANLTSNFSAQRDEQTFKGFEAIGVSRTDNFAAAAAGVQTAWLPPVIASKQRSAALFSDKEWIVADDAATSPFFGNVYICNASFRSVGLGGAPEPILFARSTDGGDSWQSKQLTSAANTGLGQGRQGCVVQTDSDGVVYVFWSSAAKQKTNPPFFDSAQLMTRSFDGGVSFERPRVVAPVQDCGLFDEATGRLSFDGIAGARTNSFPSVDIANAAPLGTGATDVIVMTWCDGPTPSVTTPGANEQALVQMSFDKGVTWTAPVNAAEAGDRPDFPAIAVSPDGTDVYLVYMAFTAPWQTTAAAPRLMQGVVRHANITGGTLGAFTTMHRGALGDARGSSQNNLAAEFLGDYNDIRATNDFAFAVWNDVRQASDCPAIDTWRLSRLTTPSPAPAPQISCAPTFGNSDIWGTRIDDPTP